MKGAEIVVMLAGCTPPMLTHIELSIALALLHIVE